MQPASDLSSPSLAVKADTYTTKRPESSFASDLLQVSSTSTLLHSQKVDPLRDAEFDYMAHSAAPSQCPSAIFFRDGCSSAMSEPRQRPPSTCVDMTGHIPIRNNHHTPIRTPPDDRWVTHTHASNPATYPGHLTFSPPVNNLSLHHAMRHSSEYQQVNGGTPAFGELPLVHRASAPAMTGLVTTLPYRGHASFQFGGQAKHHDGTSPCPKPFGEEIGSEKKWLAPSNLLVSPSQELVPSYSCGGNVLTPTNPPICRGFHVENTASAAVPHDLHDSTTGTTSGCVGDVVLIFRSSSVAL